MDINTRAFKENARKALDNSELQSSLQQIRRGFVGKRREAVERLPEFENLRVEAQEIKDGVLQNLDFYLERFEAKVVESGGAVH